MTTGRGGGLEEEQKNIEVVEVPFAQALDMVQSGEKGCERERIVGLPSSPFGTAILAKFEVGIFTQTPHLSFTSPRIKASKLGASRVIL